MDNLVAGRPQSWTSVLAAFKLGSTLIAETGKNHVIFTSFSRRALRLFYVMKLRLHDYVAAPSDVVSWTSYIYVILTSDWSGKYVLSTF